MYIVYINEPAHLLGAVAMYLETGAHEQPAIIITHLKVTDGTLPCLAIVGAIKQVGNILAHIEVAAYTEENEIGRAHV